MRSIAHTASTWTEFPVPAVFRRVSLRGALLLSVSYYFAADLGLAITSGPQPVSTLWWPNAIVLAAFLLTPTRVWWLLILGIFPAHVLVELTAGVPMAMVLCWFVSNTMEGLIGALAVRLFIQAPIRLNRFASVGVFFGAAFVGTLLSSFLDAAFVSLNDWGESGYWSVWQTRVLSNTLATLTVVPVILAWRDFRLDSLRKAQGRRLFEAGMLAATLLIVSLITFGGGAAALGPSPALMYVPFPFLLWAAVRFGSRGASAALFLVVHLSIWSAAHGLGPFVGASPAERALTFQLLFIFLAVTLTSLAAVIEERKSAQDAAELHGEQLRLVLDAAQMGTWDWPIPIVTSDRSVGPSSVPRADEEETWLTQEGFLRSVHPADRPAVTAAVLRSTREGTSFEVEFRVTRTDGDVGWVLAKGKVLRNDEHRPARLIGLSADITARKTAEMLRVAQSRVLAMIAEGAPERDTLAQVAELVESGAPGLLCTILLLESDGLHFRLAPSPTMPASLAELFEGSLTDQSDHPWAVAVWLGARIDIDDIHRDPAWEAFREHSALEDLRGFWSTPILSDRGTVLGGLGVYCREPRLPTSAEVDRMNVAVQLAAIVLERKRAESEAHEQRRALTHLGRVVTLGELSSALAHEVNQPLAAILTNVQAAQRMLRQVPPNLTEISNVLTDILASDRRAAKVIERVRAMLKKGQGQLTMIDLNEVTSETLELARSDLAAREILVDLRLAPTVPMILGDSVQLQQVLLNLTMNACDSMTGIPPIERRIVWTVGCSSNGAFVEMSIEDNGTGVPEDMIERIFEPFCTSKDTGLGLGLAICRSIVLAHQGRLWVVNNPTRGATFHLSLPVAAHVPDQVARDHPSRGLDVGMFSRSPGAWSRSQSD